MAGIVIGLAGPSSSRAIPAGGSSHNRGVELLWGDGGRVTVKVDGRRLELAGLLLLEHAPDFMIYSRQVHAWTMAHSSARTRRPISWIR